MRKKRILLVDDEVGFTRLLKLNLEQLREYEVRIENGAEQAVSAAREFRPDLVLLDLIMPHMIGNDVAQRLRADAQFRRTPIVFLSALCNQEGDERNRPIVEFPYIAKPATVEEVVDSIERNLRYSPTGSGPESSKRAPIAL